LQLAEAAAVQMALLAPLAPPPPPASPPALPPSSSSFVPPAQPPTAPPRVDGADSWHVPVAVGLGILAGIIVLCCCLTVMLLYTRQRGWSRGERAIARAQFSDSPVDSAPGRRRGEAPLATSHHRGVRKKCATVVPACEQYAPSSAGSPRASAVQSVPRRARVPAPEFGDDGRGETGTRAATARGARRPPIIEEGRQFRPNCVEQQQWQAPQVRRKRQPEEQPPQNAPPVRGAPTAPGRTCVRPRAIRPGAEVQRPAEGGTGRESNRPSHRCAAPLPPTNGSHSHGRLAPLHPASNPK
jgi:hypothetical protein